MFDRWNDPQAVAWAKEIKVRDNYTCQLCRKYGVPLNSHHLNAWDYFEELRYEISNGITLCVGCHNQFHDIYGRGRNTIFQFVQYKKSVEIFKKAILKIRNNPSVESVEDVVFIRHDP